MFDTFKILNRRNLEQALTAEGLRLEKGNHALAHDTTLHLDMLVIVFLAAAESSP